MSRTEKTIPYRIAAKRSTTGEDWHNGCELDPTGRGRERTVTTVIEHSAEWRLVDEVHDPLTDTWSRYTPKPKRRFWRSEPEPEPKLRKRWVLEPWTETITETIVEQVPCDLDEPGGRCRRWGNVTGDRYGHRTPANKTAFEHSVRSGVRVRERDDLRAMAYEYNTHGDIEDGSFEVPEMTGWW